METKKGYFVSIMKERIICESIASLRLEGLRFSVDTLAEKLGVSKKTIYKYFPNKEALAFALYQKYYVDLTAQVEKFAKENSALAHEKLLLLYFDAKSMTSCNIFNKYKLNERIYLYTAEQNDALLKRILSTLGDGVSEQDKISVRIIINGVFEKLCNEKIDPEGIIRRLVNIVW